MITRVDSKKVHRTIRYCCRTRDRFGTSSCPSKTLSEKRILATFEDKIGFKPDKNWVTENIKKVIYDSSVGLITVFPIKGRKYELKVRKEHFL